MYGKVSRVAFRLIVVTILSLSAGCHLLLPFSPAQETTYSPCFLTAQFYRQLPGSSEEFTENWFMWSWPPTTDLAGYCAYMVDHYRQRSLSPHVTWNVRNVAWYTITRDKAADCPQPPNLPKMWGGPLGARMAWFDPPSTQAYVYIYVVDRNGQVRSAEPAVKTAYIDVAKRTGMPDSATGTYIVGQEHARFADMYLSLKPFSLGDVNVTKCYVQSIGGVIARKDGPGYEYRIYPGNAKFFFYGNGNMSGNGGTTSFCFTNTTTQAVQLYQGPGMTMFALSLVLPSNELGQELLIRATLVKPWAEPSQFSAHQPYVQLTDKTLPGPDVNLTADLIGDADNDLQRVLWFKNFEMTDEQFLGTGNPCTVSLPPGGHMITCVAYDSRGAYGTGQMDLWVTPANDTCDNAQPIGPGLTWGDNTGALTDAVAPCAPSHADVWFRYVPRPTGSASYVKISTCDAGGTLKDTVLTVYKADRPDMACSVPATLCLDDGCGVENRRSQVKVYVDTRTILTIRVAGYGSSGPTGTFPLRIEEVPACPGDGDVDGDCKVTVLDIVAAVTRFGATSTGGNWDPRCDVDCDGEISVLDIVQIVMRFGMTCDN